MVSLRTIERFDAGARGVTATTVVCIFVACVALVTAAGIRGATFGASAFETTEADVCFGGLVLLTAGELNY